MLDFFSSFYLNLERGYHYIVKDILFVLGILIINYIVPRWKKEKKGKLILVGVGIAIVIWLTLMLASSFVYHFIGPGTVYAYAYPLISLLFAFLLSKDRLIERLIMGLSFYIIYIYSIRSCDTFSYIILNTKDYIKGDHTSIKVDILRSVFSFLLISLEVSVLTLFNTRKCKLIDNRGAIVLSLIYIVVHFYQSFSNKGNWVDNAIGNTLFILILYLVYVMFYLATLEYNKKIEYQFIASQNSQKLEQISLLNESYDDFRKIRHEIKNQYAIMATLLKKKEYDKLEELFSSFNSHLSDIVKYYECGNETVNPILNIEASKAKSKKIKTDFKVVISPKLNIDDGDLSAILFNLLDNAIEATERYECRSKPVLLKMWEQNDTLFISVKNYCLSEEIDINSLFTKKEDKDSHGFGVRIIKKIVKKYDGYLKFLSEDDEFTVDIYLPLIRRD